jgi:dihydroorotate dehydrogenase (NAD+) catalytic subunit|tara:strand:- start:1356 stop:2396 length:1041 start_codon:yes stop_codon:yes gene_type:complete
VQTYDRQKSYRWNYEHVPAAVSLSVPTVSAESSNGEFSFCGLPVHSPLGVPAGPLLNGKWCLYYASLGFDVVTYKTVRSGFHECYPLPNLVPVDTASLFGGEQSVSQATTMDGSWAVSYGMPSQDPIDWQVDIAETRQQLPSGKVLSVSIVGTVQPDWTLERLAEDYALCASLAVESGADCIEANFSCPNVSTCDGQLFQNPADCATVVKIIRAAIGDTPLIGKIGRLNNDDESLELIQHLNGHLDALAMTNSIATQVLDQNGTLMFEGQRRGICGKATLQASVAQTKSLNDMITEHNLDIKLIGVGGVSKVEDVRDYLAAGAQAVHIATAAMVNPLVAIEIKKAW